MSPTGSRVSPPGVPVAIELVQEHGIPVAIRPDPTSADAAQIATLIGEIPPPDWHADATAWLAAQPDPAAAADALVAEITAEGREPVILDMISAVVGELAVPAIRRQMGGPHDGLVLHWLVNNSALDPHSVDPVRFVAGLIDVLGAALDGGGPEDVITLLQDNDENIVPELLDVIWQLDHPRLAEVLEVIGAHHPAKSVSKAARKALMKHRNR